MPTRNVVLTDHQEQFVDQMVSSGRYQNASEVLREGLRMIESREEDEKSRRKALRDAANVGIADLEAGRYRTFDSATTLRSHLADLADKTVGRRAKPRRE